MTKQEALDLLKQAPADDMQSAVNRSLTRRQAVNVMRTYVEGLADGEKLATIMEKRVWQVVKNKKRV